MFKTVLLALALMATALVGAHSTAVASVGLLNVSGTWTATDLGAFECVPVDGSDARFRCVTTGFISVYDGSLKGKSTVDFSQIIDCEGGFTYGSGIEQFAGSIDGIGTGTVTWRIGFLAAFDCATFSLSGFKALGVIQFGTGDLAGVRGTLLFDDVNYRGVLRR